MSPRVVPKGGWFVNPERSRRRWAPQTLTDPQVRDILDQMASMRNYSTMPENLDRLIRARDQALIVLPWLWPKRSLEVLTLRIGDVTLDGKELAVTFKIEKHSTRFRVCSACKAAGKKERLYRNATYANYCKTCGLDISKVEPVRVRPEPLIVVKRKAVRYFFVRFVKYWVEEYGEYIDRLIERSKPAPTEAFLFPQFHAPSGTVRFDHHITNNRFNQILQKVDATLSSHMFRYGKTEQLYRLGYTTRQIKEAGDWASEKMPEIYALRKGLSPEAKLYADDIRVEEG